VEDGEVADDELEHAAAVTTHAVSTITPVTRARRRIRFPSTLWSLRRDSTYDPRVSEVQELLAAARADVDVMREALRGLRLSDLAAALADLPS
jgi:hypothetical protein